MLKEREQDMIEDAVKHGGHVKHYVAVPKFAAWITILIFFASTIFGAGLSQSQLNEHGSQLDKKDTQVQLLEARTRILEQKAAAQEKQFDEILRALERIERDVREMRK